MEDDEKNDGHEAVFCEGECQIWLHRKCAGLTHQAFAKMSKSDDPYFCVYCQWRSQPNSDARAQIFYSQRNYMSRR